MTLVNENVLVGAGVTLAGMILAGMLFLFLKVLNHLENRLTCWKDLARLSLQEAETKVRIAELKYIPQMPKLQLPKPMDFSK